jgi:hypothetical protein
MEEPGEAGEETAAETDMNFGDFLLDIEKNVFDFVKESAKAPETAWEHWQAFCAAIDWTETWLRCLLGFHVTLFLLVLLTRSSVNAQTVLFLFICSLVFSAEWLNSYCALNWPLFATQNYFDAHGVFASTLFAGPLLVILLVQLVRSIALKEKHCVHSLTPFPSFHLTTHTPPPTQINFLGLAASQLIKVKRMELKKMRREDKAAAAKDKAE